MPEIKASEISTHEGKLCPECQEGKLVQQLDHDAMEGNRSVLRCTKGSPCRFTIDIVADR